MILFEIQEEITPKRGRCRIGSTGIPETFFISGENVTGLPDDYVLAAGSTLLAPDGIHEAVADGLFSALPVPRTRRWA